MAVEISPYSFLKKGDQHITIAKTRVKSFRDTLTKMYAETDAFLTSSSIHGDFIATNFGGAFVPDSLNSKIFDTVHRWMKTVQAISVYESSPGRIADKPFDQLWVIQGESAYEKSGFGPVLIVFSGFSANIFTGQTDKLLEQLQGDLTTK